MFCDWRSDFTDRESPVPVTIASPAVFAADATRLGIGAGTVVVAYDDYFNVLAGRIVLGASQLRPPRQRTCWTAGWRPGRRPAARSRPATSPGAAEPPYPVPAQLEGLIDLDGMRAAIAGGVQLLDARKREEYTARRRMRAAPGTSPVP